MSVPSQSFSAVSLLSAGFRVIPHVPRLIRSSRRLNQVSGDDVLSTGLVLEAMAQRQPERPFLMFETQTWSYGDFNRWVNRLAHLFQSNGIGQGDCIALMYENRPELLACVLAANKLGAVAGMLNHNQRDEVLSHSIHLLKPRMVVVGEECLEAFAAQRQSVDAGVLLFCDGRDPGLQPNSVLIDHPHLRSYYRDLKLESITQPDHNPEQTRTVTLRQTCYYVFTSGTTGMPKAARMTHLRWYKAGVGMGQAAMRLNRNDILYCPLPLYHNNALTVALSSVLVAGATLALTRKFSTSGFWHDIRAFNATSFIYIGELCRYLLNAPPQHNDRDNRLRVIIGNGMRPEIWDEFQSRFGIDHVCEFYGASENNLAFVNVFNLKRTAGFCPLPYAIVKFDPDQEQPVKNAQGFLQKVKPGETGLLLSEVSTSLPFDGYTDPSATETKLLRNVFKQGDCWFNTGDLVKHQGFRHIAFVDRVGDTFRWKGENVATTEVEGVLQRLPQIDDAAVFGVLVPKCDGRAGMAAVTLKQGHFELPPDFLQHLQQKLPGYAVPLFIRIQKRQATTATFKNRKTDLKRQAYELNNGGDPVFFLRDRTVGYEPLTQDAMQQIEQGHFQTR